MRHGWRRRLPSEPTLVRGHSPSKSQENKNTEVAEYFCDLCRLISVRSEISFWFRREFDLGQLKTFHLCCRYCLLSSFSGKLINFVQKVQFRGIAQTENRRSSELNCTKVKTVQMYFVKYTFKITHILSTHIWIKPRQKECIQTRLVIEGSSSSMAMRRKDLR